MKTIKFSMRLFYALSLLLLVFTACKDDNGDDPKPGENPDPSKSTLTAKAGKDTTVQVSTILELDGGSSTDSENKTFTYQWTILKKPAGSNAALSNADKQKPKITPDKVGEYEVELTIANDKYSNKDRLIINAIVASPLEIKESIKVQTVLEDRIEDPELPDYIVSKDISVVAELKIKPGVVVAFARNVKMAIEQDGTIIAEGTAEKKIKFTGVEHTPAFWRGIIVYSKSTANILNHVEIKYSGSQPLVSAKKAALAIYGQDATLSIKNTLISNNEGYGLFVSNYGSLREFSTNTFINNTEAGIVVEADEVLKLDFNSVFTGGNGRNVVEIISTAIDSPNDSEVVWPGFNDKTPYLITSDIIVTARWKLNPGVTIKVARGVKIAINDTGYMNAEGTATNKIVITGAEPSVGYWRGLIFYSTSNMNKFRNVEVSYSGSNTLVSGKKANIAIYGKDVFLDIQNCEIKGCSGYGIFVSYTAILNANAATANTFVENTQGAIFKE